MRPMNLLLRLVPVPLLLATANSDQFFLRPAPDAGGGGARAAPDGKSYSSAWRSVNSVQWSVLEPGDTLFVCGLGYGPFNLRAGWSGTPAANVRYLLLDDCSLACTHASTQTPVIC